MSNAAFQTMPVIVRRAAVLLAATALGVMTSASMFKGIASAADATEMKTDSLMKTGSLVTAADMQAANKLFDAYEKTPPFSFTYGGKTFADSMANWTAQSQAQTLDANRTQRVATWSDPATGLAVRMVAIRYNDFPAIEWTVYLKNDGKADSPPIDNLRGLDAAIANGTAGEVTVHSEKGSEALDTDYQMLPLPLSSGKTIELASRGGRGSDGAAIPYFNFETPGAGGVCLAIGWPGQWDATFKLDGDAVRVSTGQENVNTILHPGEEIRTPLMAIVPYTGTDVQRGQNIWRRWMIAHNIPRVDGKMVGPMLCANSSHIFGEMIRANEQNQKQYSLKYFERGINLDYWWMDAGWYENIGRWENTGTWKIDAKRFPNGFKPIAEAIKSKGAKPIVWFEPERVTPQTEIYEKHSEFLLTRGGGGGLRLLTLPNAGGEPNVGVNASAKPFTSGEITWAPGAASMHPGPKGEYAVARFAAPEAGKYAIDVKFSAGDKRATTDVHVIHRGKSLLEGQIAPAGQASQNYSGELDLKRGEIVGFAVGVGANNDYACDTTLVQCTIKAPDGKSFELSKELQTSPDDESSKSPWSFGAAPKGDIVKTTQFAAFTRGKLNPVDGATWKLFNFGNPEARKWITDRIDSIIKSQQIGVYRQDFNIEPLDFWRGADAPDRQGMTENLYVQGYLKYWDDLLTRNPTIYIDSCASGGRRNDLETMRRSVPFLRSDRLFYPVGQQSQSFGLFQWLPLNGSPTMVGKSAIFGESFGDKISPYVFRSDMAPIFNLCTDILDEKLDYNTFRKLVKDWRDIGPCYLGDYYPLTDSTLDANKWMAWQFYLPEKGEGFIQAFRRDQAADATSKIKLHGLDRNATYELMDVDHSDQTKSLSGAVLLDEGVDVAVNAKPGDALIRIHKK